MSLHSLEMELRQPADFGKGAVGRLRQQGMTPGNLISSGQSTPVVFPESKFEALCQAGIRRTTFLHLEVKGGTSGRYLVKELQRHPVTGRAIHVDFYRMQEGRRFFVSVPVEAKGLARGVKAGGVFEQYIRHLPVRTVPESLQEIVEIDVSDMDVGESLSLKELLIPADWEVRLEGNPIILRIAHSRLVTQVAPDEEGQAAAVSEGSAE